MIASMCKAYGAVNNDDLIRLISKAVAKKICEENKIGKKIKLSKLTLNGRII